jgi:transposase-like protein
LFAAVWRCPLGRKSKYSAEFQALAVRLLLEPGATNESVGRDLGISRETVRLWARRLAAETDPEVRRAREEHAELVALRRRVKVLEEEREILAKAAAFRARETRRTR